MSCSQEAVGGNPALLTFFDFHTALATPPALAAAGITGARSFDDASEIVCRPDGRPTGELREEAIGLVVEAMPVPGDEQRLAYIAEALAAMNRVGLTASHMMDGTLATPDDCRALERSGRLTVRQVVPFTVQPTMERRRDRRGHRGRRTVRAAVAVGLGEVLHRRRCRVGHRVARRAGHRGTRHRAELARSGALRRGDRALRRGRDAVDHARHRRSQRALRARRLPRGPGRWRAGRTASSTSRRCRTTSCRGSHRSAWWHRSRSATCSG